MWLDTIDFPVYVPKIEVPAPKGIRDKQVCNWPRWSGSLMSGGYNEPLNSWLDPDTWICAHISSQLPSTFSFSDKPLRYQYKYTSANLIALVFPVDIESFWKCGNRQMLAFKPRFYTKYYICIFSSKSFLSTMEWQFTIRTFKGISSLCLLILWCHWSLDELWTLSDEGREQSYWRQRRVVCFSTPLMNSSLKSVSSSALLSRMFLQMSYCCRLLYLLTPFFISSPEPKTHRWAYSIARHPSSVRRQHFQTTFPLKPWSWLLLLHIASTGRRNVKLCFCSNQIRTLVAMATFFCLCFIMGKLEIGIYCYHTADILTKVLQKCSFSSPVPSIRILSKPLNMIGCHGNRKAKFVKKY